jgi:hypothetical protein
MFYIVPKDRSIIRSLSTFDALGPAKAYALELKELDGLDYDVIFQSRVWTTQTLGEAHMLSPDVPHIGRD